jgi:hypothetical protein
MDPFIVSLVGALSAGAIEAAKSTATQAIKDAYTGVRGYIARHYAHVELAGLERDPASQGQQLVVQEHLAKEPTVTADPTLPQLVAALVEALKAQPHGPPEGVNLGDISAAINVQIERIGTGGGNVRMGNVTAHGGSVMIKDVGLASKN